MANNKRGKRGGSEFNRSVKQAGRLLESKGSNNNTALICESFGDHWERSEVAQETVETHIVPRRSLTKQQHLRVFPQELEFEDLKPIRRFQIDKRTKQLIETTEPNRRLVWKSDQTLLNRGLPDQFGEGSGTYFKRVTSHSKRITTEVEVKPIDGADLSLHGTIPIHDPLNLKKL